MVAVIVALALGLALVGPWVVSQVILRPGAREQGQFLSCQSQLRKIRRALEVCREKEGRYPMHFYQLEGYTTWLDPENPRPRCPAAVGHSYRAGYQVASDGLRCTVVCKGQNHPGVAPDTPGITLP